MHCSFPNLPDGRRLVACALSSFAVSLLGWPCKQIPGDLTTVSDLNSYCQGYLKKFKQPYFVQLHFQDGVNKEKMKFEELRGYYSTLPDKEEKKTNEEIAKMEHDEQVGLFV